MLWYYLTWVGNALVLPDMGWTRYGITCHGLDTLYYLTWVGQTLVLLTMGWTRSRTA